MKKTTVSICILVLVLALVGASWWLSKALLKNIITSGTHTAVLPPSKIVPPTKIPSDTVYENQYMKLAVPAGWVLTEATQTLQDQVYDKNTGQVTKVGEPKTTKTGAVNIVKDNYILYINPAAGQASGVAGGRFGEIAGGAPSADAVITDRPSLPCKDAETNPAVNGWLRSDLYVSSTDKVDWCNSPTNGKTVWYFSYVTGPKGGYFNYYKQGGTASYVITMAYNSKDINNLPAKDSPALTAALEEMTNILGTLELRQIIEQG